MSKKKEISEIEMSEISEKTGVDPDILKSWYKGILMRLFIFKNNLIKYFYD